MTGIQLDSSQLDSLSTVDDSLPSTAKTHKMLSNESRPRQRAFLACIECRWRKRRCDVYEKGAPCTMCREQGRLCTVRKRQRKSSRLSGVGANVDNGQHLLEDDMASVSDTCSPDHEGMPDGHREQESRAVTVIDGNANTTVPTKSPRSCLETGVSTTSCDFLKPCGTGHLLPDDMDFLERRGCFHVPRRPEADRLVLEYFRRVHPQLPILVEDAFGAAYHHHDFIGSESRQISVFLFQSMLCIACSVC